jgi:hypothetical protein
MFFLRRVTKLFFRRWQFGGPGLDHLDVQGASQRLFNRPGVVLDPSQK